MRVLVVDDDKLVAVSLKTILEADGEITVVGLGEAGDDAIRLYREQHPDILLMDIRMQGMNGTEALAELLRIFPEAKVLFLTTFVDDEYIVKALELGAKGYIIKQNFEHIIPALEAVYSGQNVYGDEIISKIPNLIKASDSFDYTDEDINEKEYEIITLVAEGLSNREIASRLCLSEGTIRNYLSSILEKLNLRDRTQLAIFYYKHKR